MTNKKAILGISLAAAFAVSMIFAQNAIADPPASRQFTIQEFSFETYDDMAKVDLRADQPFPRTAGAFGVGVFTDSSTITNNVLGITGHICAADSPVQGDTVNEIKRCPFEDQGSIGVLEFLRDNVPAQFGDLPTGEIDQANDGGDIHPHILDLKDMDTDCSGKLAENNLSPGDVAVEVDVLGTLGLDPIGTPNNISPDDYLVKHAGQKVTVGNIPLSDLGGDEVQAVATFNILPLHSGSTITNLCLYDVKFQDLP